MHSLAVWTLLAILVPRALALCAGNPLYPQWYCDTCALNLGTNSTGCDYYGGRFICYPYNATFDSIPTGSIHSGAGVYGVTEWKGFDVVSQNATGNLLSFVAPHSEPHYAQVASGANATLDLSLIGLSGGWIRSLYFACTLPYLGLPVDCQLKVTAQDCVVGDDIGRPVTNVTTFDYKANLFGASMQYAENVGPQGLVDGSLALTACMTYTFSATSTFGLPVDVFIDDVICAGVEYIAAAPGIGCEPENVPPPATS